MLLSVKLELDTFLIANMEIAECINQEKWDNFIGEQKYSQFLHSWEWGELQEKEGRKIWRMAIQEERGKEILAVFALIKMTLINNYCYFYTPRGPIFKGGYDTKEAWVKISEKIKELAIKENIVFWRFEPIALPPSEIRANFKEVPPIQPKNTLILNLESTEEDLLKKMHSKTRYNIKLAQKKGVRIKEAENTEKELNIFWELLNTTAERQKFGLHNFEHYLNITKSRINSKLYIASCREKNIAGILNISFGNTATYLHGASANEFRNLMPAPLLQWEAIKEAKKAGYKYYDFWGINKTDSRAKWDYKKDWEGITRFKTGFGGEEINFPGAYELPINNIMYDLYKIYKLKKYLLLNNF